MSTPMTDIPDHFPIGVDNRGRGPVMEHEKGFDHYVCWCGDPACEKWRDNAERIEQIPG